MSSRVQRMEAEMMREFGGTFVPENRSQAGCFGTTKFMPEVAEEEERLVHNDRLRTRRIGKTFRSRATVSVTHWGHVERVSETRQEWALNDPFVPLEDIVDSRTDFQVQTDEVDDND